MSELRLSGIIRESIVDGPGIRFVVFSQGCPHRCEGCHNPQTHDFDGGNLCSIDRILEEIDKDPLLSGVTFSGGEPFWQPEAFCELADGVIERDLDIIIYSGYTYEELLELAESKPAVLELMKKADILIDGRFELEKRTLALPFRGSSNQRIIDLKKSLECGKIIEKEI